MNEHHSAHPRMVARSGYSEENQMLRTTTVVAALHSGVDGETQRLRYLTSYLDIKSHFTKSTTAYVFCLYL